MPFIHIRAHSGRDLDTKRKTAEAVLKAASAAMNAPEEAFTVAFEDIEREKWEKDIAKAIIEPMQDKVLIAKGKPV